MDDIVKQDADLFIKEQFEYIINVYSNILEEYSSTNLNISDIYKRRGDCYEKINKYKDAIEDYKKSILLDKFDTNAYKKLYNCYLIIGDINEAKEIFERMSHNQESKCIFEIEKIKLEEIEIKEKLIKGAYEKNDYDQVIDLINKLSIVLQKHLDLKAPKVCTQYEILKAECLIYLAKFNESIQILNNILCTNQNNKDALFIRAMNYLHQRKYKLGLKDLKDSMNNCPKAKQFYEKYKYFERSFQKAHDLKNTNLNEAKTIYLQLLEIDPKNKSQNNSIYYELAKISYVQNKFNDTIIFCTEILFDDEKNLNGLKLRAKAYQKIQNYEDALEDCKEIVMIENSAKNNKFLNKIKVLNLNNFIDNYARLGVKKGATLSEITRVWRQLARKYHPDKNVESKAQQFIAKRQLYRINKAYKELKEQLNNN